jgi:serine/threonine-protein kinase
MTTFGRYQILEELGRGASSIVYKALDPAIGRTLAIKVIELSRLPARERQAVRPRLEAQSLGRLAHPNVVTIFDIVEEPQRVAILMEFVDGPSLDKLGAGSMPPKRILVELLRQVAAALDFAHSNGVVHGDIKPANILIHQGRTAKIADFGGARIDSATGPTTGSPAYLAPERITAVPPGPAADQYALGVVAFELLSGHRPFQARTIPELLLAIAKQEPPSVLRFNPSLGITTDQVLRRVLSKDPRDRYPSCLAFADALRASLEGEASWNLPGKSTPAPTSGAEETHLVLPAAPAASDARPARRQPYRLALLLCAILIAGSVWYLSTRPQPRASQPSEPAESVSRPTAMPPDTKPAETPSQPAPTGEPKPQGPPEPSPAAGPAEPQTIQFVSNPPGVLLQVDQETECQTPCQLELPPGEHRVRATKDNYQPQIRTLKVPGETEVFLSMLALQGELVIRSTPDGATVLLNGNPLPGRTPTRAKLPPGRYTIEVQKDGFVRDSGEVQIKDATVTTINAQLTPQP